MSGETPADRLTSVNPPADGAAPEAEQVLYESGRTRVVRVRLAGATASVILKEPVGRDAARRLRRERSMLERLAGVPGVVRLLADQVMPRGVGTSRTMVVADAGTVSLATARSTGPLDLPDLLTIAIQLAGTIAAVHRRGVVHRDVTPTNVMWSAQARQVTLIDFDLATTAAEERPGFTHTNDIAGTLAYIAPEQTGRTGRSVDYRADLYGLGATLYELATGAPPFGFTGPLQLVHDHLTRLPVPPVERNQALPASFSEIIVRLLEKEPDRRYQSADGLEHDLRQVHDAWSRGQSPPLVLGDRDFPLRLAAPSRPIGRDPELKALAAALTAALTGPMRGLLLGGVPGVGKTTLLNHLRPLAGSGYFATGKFDQYRRDEEADGIRQALRGLGRLLLAEPEGEIVELRASLLEHLGANARLIAGVLPEFGSILGVTPEPFSGDILSMAPRLNQAGLDVLRAVASPSRPVILAIDDLQWATATPVGFIDLVLTDTDLRGVLLVWCVPQHGR